MDKEFAIATMFTNAHATLTAKAKKASDLLTAALVNKTIQVWDDESPDSGMPGWVDVTPEYAIEHLDLQNVDNFRIKE